MNGVSPDFTSPDRFDRVATDLVRRAVHRLELRHVRVASAFAGMELQYKAISCVLDVVEALVAMQGMLHQCRNNQLGRVGIGLKDQRHLTVNLKRTCDLLTRVQHTSKRGNADGGSGGGDVKF